MMDWRSVYSNFAVNENFIWLNNCGAVPAGRHIVDALTRFIGGYAAKGILTDVAVFESVQGNIKRILASLLGCHARELALIHNTAEGMNFISHGLALHPGDEVILLENEYPSNVYPWWHLQDKGVRLRMAPLADTPEDFLSSLQSVITDQTRVVSISAVHWCTGMPLPIVEVGRLCRAHGIDLVVDGAQGIGMQPLDVKQAGIACMAFPAWKWLMGPLGLGILYVAQEKLDEVSPVFMGTASVVRDQEYLPYKSELKPSADRFTFSTPNFNDWVYFEAALSYLETIGFDRVHERLLELSGLLRRGLRQAGFSVYADRFPAHRTAIVVCEKAGMAASAILAQLKAHRIVAAERLGRIRFSPHIYIAPEQLERVVDALVQI